MNTISKNQAWAIFEDRNTPDETTKWEWPDDERFGGLLLGGCPTCGEFQTRETYVNGFWAEFVELVTDYTCCGIARCQCGQWVRWVH